MVEGNERLKTGLPLAPREQDRRLTNAREDQPGDPTLEWLEVEPHGIGEVTEAAISGLHGRIGATEYDSRQLASFRADSGRFRLSWDRVRRWLTTPQRP